MARKSNRQVEGRSSISRGRKRYDLEESEREEELRNFLQDGADFDTIDTDGETDKDADQEAEATHRPYHLDSADTFGSIGQILESDN